MGLVEGVAYMKKKHFCTK